MDVAFVIPSRATATDYYRLRLPARYFTRVKVNQYALPATKKDQVSVKEFVDTIKEDIIILHRISLEFTSVIAEYANLQGKKVVFDTDDVEFNLPKNHHLRDWYPSGPMKEAVKQVMRNAVECWVTTEDLRRELNKLYTTPTIVIPNAPDIFEPQWHKSRIQHNPLIIGWVGGVSHLPDLPLCASALKQLLDEGTDFILKLCGVPPKDQQFELVSLNGSYMKNTVPEERRYENLLRNIFNFMPEEKLRLENALPLDRYAEFYRDIDIILAPCVRNGFNNCKSELKILEAGLYKIPVVVSDIRSYTGFARRFSGSVNIADTPSSWYRHLSRLIQDPIERKVQGENLFNAVVSGYNLAYWSKYREERLLQLCN